MWNDAELINWETAQLIKEKELSLDKDWANGTNLFYDNGHLTTFKGNNIPAITQSNLQRYLITRHKVAPLVQLDNTLSWIWIITPLCPSCHIETQKVSTFVYQSYEEALEVVLQETLKLL